MKRIGIFGSGQLGQMIAEEARRLGHHIYCYSPDANSPSSKVGVSEVVGSYEDLDKIFKFAETVDLITFEFENIPKLTLDFLDTHFSTKLFPNPQSLVIAQDRYLEKSRFRKLGFLTANFLLLNKDTKDTIEPFPFPWIIKTLRFGYDGKGQFKINSRSDYENFLKSAFADPNSEYLIEEVVSFQKEISVVLTRFHDGSIFSFGSIENIHKNHILDLSIYPAELPSEMGQKADDMARVLAEDLKYVGTMGVEFFLKDSVVYLNEFAPRPHNSGHFSQDCGSHSQFLLHTLAILGYSAPKFSKPNPTVMKNILGNDFKSSCDLATLLVAGDSRYKLHLYSKEEAKVNRKMGHINFMGKLTEVDPRFLTI